MTTQITLSQYIDSKKQLMESIKTDPIVEHEYSVTKYCKLPVGESDCLKEYVSLKPKTKIAITWHYVYDRKHEELHEMKRTPIRICITDHNVTNTHQLYQTDERLSNWILTNTKIVSQ